MNAPRTIVRRLLFAAAFLALGLIASNRRAVVPPPARCGQAAAVLSQIARAQAAAALSPASGTASLLPFGL